MEDEKRYIACCGSRKLDEIDGQEFEAHSLEELIEGLKQYKEVHLAYWSDEDDDLDLWIRVVE